MEKKNYYIGIDPSITSTGMSINGKMFSYSYNTAGLKKKGGFSKWYELSKDNVLFRFHNQVNVNDYSEEQLAKHISYSGVVDSIITDILDFTQQANYIYIAMEGFSYSSASGNLIDLVTFSTLLRDRLINDVGAIIEIVTPTSLKLEACKMTYPVVITTKGKRVIRQVKTYENYDGVKGGSFKKPEMFFSIVHNESWKDNWSEHLRECVSDINGGKIPKPHEDLNDAYLLQKFIYKKYTK